MSMQPDDNPVAAPAGSGKELRRAGWRIRPSWVGDSGTVYYALQQRRWWGWKTWHRKFTRYEAMNALETCARDWPVQPLEDSREQVWVRNASGLIDEAPNTKASDGRKEER